MQKNIQWLILTHILVMGDGEEWDYPPSDGSEDVEDFAKVEIRSEKVLRKRSNFYSQIWLERIASPNSSENQQLRAELARFGQYWRCRLSWVQPCRLCAIQTSLTPLVSRRWGEMWIPAFVAARKADFTKLWHKGDVFVKAKGWLSRFSPESVARGPPGAWREARDAGEL